MSSVQKSLRIPGEIAKAIEEEAKSSNRDFSTVANQFLAEAVRMKRCPGIVFAVGPAGRRARIAGTGLDIWEVIATYIGVDNDFNRLSETYHWLSEPQLRAALGYFKLYREEIERQIRQNEAWTHEQLVERHPSLVFHQP